MSSVVNYQTITTLRSLCGISSKKQIENCVTTRHCPSHYEVNGQTRTRRHFHLCSELYKKRPSNMKGKSHSSQRWIDRHVNDQFVQRARVENYRARSAYKLLEIDSKYRLLLPGHTVIDCGAAPGSWTQVAVEKTNSNLSDESKPQGTVVAVDILHMQPVDGAVVLDQCDFTDHETQDKILTHLGGQLANVVLSDMAPNATGIHSMDHDQIVALVRAADKLARQILRENGDFLAKLWDGHDTGTLRRDLSNCFRSVKILRPEASRKESSEIYLLAKGFKRYEVHPP